MNPIYEQVKQAVSLEDALRLYGCDTGRNGMARCPFHGEDKHPSMNVRNNFYFCHTCGAHGDVIGFVSQYFGLRPSAAVMKLDNDFHLGIVGKRITRAERSRIQEERETQQKELEAFREVYRKKEIIRRSLWAAYIRKAPKTPDEPINDRYAEAVKMLPAYDRWFEENPYR